MNTYLEFEKPIEQLDNKVHELKKAGKINLFTKYQMHGVKGNGKLEGIDIKHDNEEIKNKNGQYYFGQGWK